MPTPQFHFYTISHVSSHQSLHRCIRKARWTWSDWVATQMSRNSLGSHQVYPDAGTSSVSEVLLILRGRVHPSPGVFQFRQWAKSPGIDGISTIGRIQRYWHMGWSVWLLGTRSDFPWVLPTNHRSTAVGHWSPSQNMSPMAAKRNYAAWQFRSPWAVDQSGDGWCMTQARKWNRHSWRAGGDKCSWLYSGLSLQ